MRDRLVTTQHTSGRSNISRIVHIGGSGGVLLRLASKLERQAGLTVRREPWEAGTIKQIISSGDGGAIMNVRQCTIMTAVSYTSTITTPNTKRIHISYRGPATANSRKCSLAPYNCHRHRELSRLQEWQTHRLPPQCTTSHLINGSQHNVYKMHGYFNIIH